MSEEDGDIDIDFDFEFDEEGYEQEEKDNIAEFGAYRDLGPEGRLGGAYDEDLNLHIPLDKEGNVDRTRIDDRTKFALDLLDVLKEYNETFLHLGGQQIKFLKQEVDSLHFIRLKNALPYVLGYFIFFHNFSKSKIRVISSLIKEDKNLTMFEILKYARYWQNKLK